jgi:hypothetical protein
VLTSGRLTFHKATKLEHRENASRRFISLELEVAGDDGDGACYVSPVARKWRDAIVEDGSLPDSGYEVNTNPTSGDLFIEHIAEMCDGLRGAGAHTDNSCGMHCHVSADDFTYFDLFKLCRLYSHIELALYGIVAPSRRHSHYSQPCGETYTFDRYETFKRDLLVSLYGDDVLLPSSHYGKHKPHPSVCEHRGKKRLRATSERYNGARYNALNLHSFFYRGTIEFRHHQGTVNTAKATNWGLTCAAILDAAQRLSMREIDALVNDTTPHDALLAILPTAALRNHANERRANFTR